MNLTSWITAFPAIVITLLSAVGEGEAATLYGIRARSDSELYSINQSTGGASLLGQTGIFVGDGLAPSSSPDFLWAARGDELYSVSTTSGTATMVRDFANALSINGLAYDAGRDILYGSDYSGGNIYLIVPSTGVVSLLGSGASVHGLAYSSSRDTLYGVGTDSLFAIDVVSGATTSVGSLGVEFSTGGSGLSYDPQADVLYAASRNQTDLYAIEPDVGLAISVGSLGVSAIHGLASVPEPNTSLLLMLASSLTLAFRSRRAPGNPKRENKAWVDNPLPRRELEVEP